MSSRRGTLAIMIALLASPLAMCGLPSSTSSARRADPEDPRTTAVVQLVEGDRSEAEGSLPTTSPACTGTLVSPRLVLTAAHCFGQGAPGVAARGWLVGGDPACVVVDASGAVVATGGCGQVVFTDVLGQVRERQIVRRVFVGRAVPLDDARQSRAPDIALALLDHRATPRTSARATPVRPWLEDDLPAEAWRGRTNASFGWGEQGPLRAGTTDCAPLEGSESAAWLHWDATPLDAQDPLREAPPNEVDEAGAMFIQRFDAFGDISGFLLPGDSGGPMFMTDARGELRVVAVASSHLCAKHGAACAGEPVRESGTLLNLWARTMDERSGNRAFLRAIALAPDGTLLGDDVPNPGCSAEPATPDASDPDCDLVPTEGTPWRAPDNCPFLANPDQADRDGDGVGDACDATLRPPPARG